MKIEIKREKNKFLINKKKPKTKNNNSKILERKSKDIKFIKIFLEKLETSVMILDQIKSMSSLECLFFSDIERWKKRKANWEIYTKSLDKRNKTE